MGFTALVDSAAGEDFYRAHLVMNGTFANPAYGGIPYLSLGAEHYRGNGSQVGSMAIQPGYSFCFRCRVKFKAKLWDFLLPDPVGSQPATLAFYLFARSYWDGKPRGLFITLAHWGIGWSGSTSLTNSQWNWPIQDSFYSPGADIAYMDAEDIQPLCGISVPRLVSMGQQISYQLDLRPLFNCASNNGGFDSPIPPGRPIEGVHWAVEMTGEDGWLWVSVHDMEVVAGN